MWTRCPDCDVLRRDSKSVTTIPSITILIDTARCSSQPETAMRKIYVQNWMKVSMNLAIFCGYSIVIIPETGCAK